MKTAAITPEFVMNTLVLAEGPANAYQPTGTPAFGVVRPVHGLPPDVVLVVREDGVMLVAADRSRRLIAVAMERYFEDVVAVALDLEILHHRGCVVDETLNITWQSDIEQCLPLFTADLLDLTAYVVEP